MTTTLPIGLHTAYLDAMTGVGLMACPPSGADVDLPEDWEPEPVQLRIGTELVMARPSVAVSVHHADYLAARRALERQDWHVNTDDDSNVPLGQWGAVLAGYASGGGEVVLLHHNDPVRSEVSYYDLADALAELANAADMVPLA